MPLYDFVCDGGHTTEAIRPSDTRAIDCACGGTARRTGVNVGIGIVGPTTDTRGMFRRYTEASAEIAHGAARYERDNARPAPEPNLWQRAKQRADAKVAAGEAPPVSPLAA